MKPGRKFNHTDYLKDLQKVEQTIQRVRSNSKSSTQMSRDSSQRALHENTSCTNLTKVYNYKYLTKEKSDFIKTRPRAEWSMKTKNENIPMLGETNKLEKCINNLKQKVSQLDEQTVKFKHVELQAMIGEKQDPQELFIKKIEQLYQISPKIDNISNLKRITCEIQTRDDVYEVVENKFNKSPPSEYQRLTLQWFEEGKVMEKIISIFKAMSKVDIEDYQDLYDFLREE